MNPNRNKIEIIRRKINPNIFHGVLYLVVIRKRGVRFTTDIFPSVTTICTHIGPKLYMINSHP